MRRGAQGGRPATGSETAASRPQCSGQGLVLAARSVAGAGTNAEQEGREARSPGSSWGRRGAEWFLADGGILSFWSQGTLHTSLLSNHPAPHCRHTLPGPHLPSSKRHHATIYLKIIIIMKPCRELVGPRRHPVSAARGRSRDEPSGCGKAIPPHRQSGEPQTRLPGPPGPAAWASGRTQRK